MKKQTLLLALLAASIHADEPAWIPRPAQMDRHEGVFGLDVSTGIAPGPFLAEAQQLAARTRLRIAPDGAIAFAERADLPPEGYELQVTPSSAVIRASSAAGAFYGAQTLLQLLPTDMSTGGVGRAISLPCLLVRDVPRFPWRGMMLDASRHFQTTGFVKRYLDLMAAHKLNTFHWHLTDGHGWRIAIANYPLLTQVGAFREQPPVGRYGGFYTQAEIRDIVAYASARHIAIVPEIEMPGHSRAAIAAYPSLSCRKAPQKVDYFYDFPCRAQRFPSHPGTDVFCVSQEETFTFITNVLTEVMALFPGRYIHVGGDEVNVGEWNACAGCRSRMKERGLKNGHQLQAWFMQRVEAFLADHGRRLIGWDEILEGGLGPDATVMSWRGTQGGLAAAQSGHDAVMSPGQPLYFDHGQSDHPSEPAHWPGTETLEEIYRYDPIPAGLTPDQARHILGAQANLWSCFTHTDELLELQTFPRLLALAEIAWTPTSRLDWLSFQERLGPRGAWLDAQGVARWQEPPPAREIGAWSPGEIGTQAVTRVWEIGDAAGAITIDFDYQQGAHKLDIHRVALLEGDREVAADEHFGFTGSRDQDNRYRLALPAAAGGASYRIAARVSCDGGSDSKGRVLLSRQGWSPRAAPPVPVLSTTTPATQDRDRATYNWQKRHEEVLARHRIVKPEVVVFGDSIMHYWGGAPAAPHSWGAAAWSNCFAGLEVSNLGFGWDRTENVLWRIAHGELDGIAPRVVVLKIGTNNIGLNSPEEIAAGIAAICGAIRAKLPQARILLLGILPRKDERPGEWAPSDQVNYLLQTRLGGAPGIAVRDFGNALRKADGSLDAALYRDGVHINADGYARLGARIRAAIDAL